MNIFKDTDKKEILVKGLSFLTIRVLGLFAGYLFTYLVVKFYGAEVYGLVVLGFSLFVFMGVLGRLGIDINLVKHYSLEENRLDIGLFYRAVLISFLFSAFLSVILFFSKDFLSNTIFKKPNLAPYLIWVAISIPFWSLTIVCAGYLRAIKKNHWFAFLNNTGRFIFTILFLILLAKFFSSHLVAIKAHTYGVILLAGLAFFLCLKSLGGLSLKSENNTWLFIRGAFPMMLSASMLILMGWIDTFILGIYESELNIGIYNVALKVAMLSSFTLQAINSILAPKLADTNQKGDMVAFSRLVRFSTKYIFIFTAITVILILICRSWILALFGSEFVAGSFILVILCLGQLVNSLAGSVGVILQMTGHQRIYQNIIFIALILNIILNFVLIPVYGGLGAAIATTVSIASWNIIGSIYLKKKLGIQSYYMPIKLRL